MADQILTPRKKAPKTAAKANTYCPTCNETELFCFCKNKVVDVAKELKVTRIKRGTFLFYFGGAK